MLALLLAATAATSDGAAATTANPCEGEILRASAKYGVPAGILYAVGLAETGRKGSLQPNALNIDGAAVFPTSRNDALRRFETAATAGAKFIDVGCMQINHRYHGDKFAGVSDMLEPRRNVDYAARFLVQLKGRHQTWTMAVARYHAGPNNDPAQQRYVCRVITNMVASGFGNWTPEAKAFCNH